MANSMGLVLSWLLWMSCLGLALLSWQSVRVGFEFSSSLCYLWRRFCQCPFLWASGGPTHSHSGTRAKTKRKADETDGGSGQNANENERDDFEFKCVVCELTIWSLVCVSQCHECDGCLRSFIWNWNEEFTTGRAVVVARPSA